MACAAKAEMEDEGGAKLEIESKTENLSRVREFMSKQVSASQLPPAERGKVILAVDEAVANIMKHSYEEVASGTITISVKSDAERLEIHVMDSGKKFDPNSIRDIDIIQHVKEGRKTGLGIFLMRQIMDEVEYSFKEGQRNELRLVKYVKPKPRPGPAVQAGGGAKGA